MVLNSEIFEKITGFKSAIKWVATGICIDSRKIKKGDLFIAFKGENVNGNDFAKNALLQGASACLVTELKNQNDLKEYPLVLINNPFDVIKQIASYKRENIQSTIVAITGSYGKTTSKDMIVTTLKNNFNISFTNANENNTLGAPLSLARMDFEDNLGVFELGMNHKGEINEIVKTLNPDIAIMTEIAPLHFENFNSLQEIVDAKLEILNNNKCNTLIVSKDDKNYNYIVQKAQQKGVKRILSYGFSKDANCSLKKAELVGLKYNVVATLNNNDYSFTLNTVALHNVKIALLCLCLCSELNLNINNMLKNIENFSVVKGRGNIENIVKDGKHITLFNDSYNASGMEESIANFAKISQHNSNILILGQMLELGAISKQKHESLAKPILSTNHKFILLVGKEMLYLKQELEKENIKPYYFETVENLNTFLESNLQDGDFVFIKGSYGSNVYKVANKLLGWVYLTLIQLFVIFNQKRFILIIGLTNIKITTSTKYWGV